jgi:hypothetical protein
MWKSPVSTPSTRAARWLAMGAATGLLIAAAATVLLVAYCARRGRDDTEHTSTVSGIGG